MSIFGKGFKFNWKRLFWWLQKLASESTQMKYLIGILSVAARKAIRKNGLRWPLQPLIIGYDIIIS